MGYVRGRMHPQDEKHPKDSAVLAEVVDACLAFPDLYPAINAVSQQAAARETDETAPGQARRVLTPDEYTTAWHAVEAAAGEPGADPGAVLLAVLDRLGIQPPPTA